ncbi:MAG TPA: DNA-3-methyladenine glycosylase [Candidatus Saccharimonadales bacterium]|nr:DNA-3-methyladenine glycosylase [Candidatus Saccharimonadales bacterium]
MDDWSVLNGPAWEVAPRLLGCLLVRELDGQRLVGRIVETEAYDQTDAASHSYRGRTPRTDVMFGPAGHLYVYFTYGMHYCMNVVCRPEGHGSAVLIRAIEPLEGIDVLSANRGNKTGVQITNGPAKLCQALAIDRTWNGHNLQQPPFQLLLQPPPPATQITQTTRVGITQAAHVPWRFYITENHYVSHI